MIVTSEVEKKFKINCMFLQKLNSPTNYIINEVLGHMKFNPLLTWFYCMHIIMYHANREAW